MVGHVAGRFAREPAVAGYDVMNEPNAFGGAELQGLSDLYAATVSEVRAAEQRAGGFPHLVFFEPSILWSDTDAGVPPPFPHDGNVVFAPHIYRGGLTSGPVERSDFERARRDAATFGGAPVLTGEWGSGPERAEDPDDVYFRSHQQLQDEFEFGATLWTWRESCGDPHKAGDARAGRVPSVWGEFEVDCTTNTVTGPRRPLLAQLRRAYARVSPGELGVSHSDLASGVFLASGRGARPGERLEVWYPTRHGRPDELSFLGLRHMQVRSAGSGGAIVTATTTGDGWVLLLTR
jgi:endoglycosylceramidase